MPFAATRRAVLAGLAAALAAPCARADESPAAARVAAIEIVAAIRPL